MDVVIGHVVYKNACRDLVLEEGLSSGPRDRVDIVLGVGTYSMSTRGVNYRKC